MPAKPPPPRLRQSQRPPEPLDEPVNEQLLSPMGRRDWPLRSYSPARLLSVEAQREFMPPDIAALP